MSDPISLLLESEAATRRLAHLFQSEELDRTTRQSIAMLTRDSSGAARRDKNGKMPQENRHERAQVCSRTTTVTPNIGSGASKRDLTVFSFMLALVLAGVVVAAQTDHPVFWLLIGPVPVAILHTTMTFVRQHVLRRKGRSCSADGLGYVRRLFEQAVSSKQQSIDAGWQAISYAADSKHQTLKCIRRDRP